MRPNPPEATWGRNLQRNFRGDSKRSPVPSGWHSVVESPDYSCVHLRESAETPSMMESGWIRKVCKAKRSQSCSKCVSWEVWEREICSKRNTEKKPQKNSLQWIPCSLCALRVSSWYPPPLQKYDGLINVTKLSVVCNWVCVIVSKVSLTLYPMSPEILQVPHDPM